MGSAFLYVAALCLLLAAGVPADAQILVMSPPSLAKHFSGNRIRGSTTTIGAPFYGDRVLGQIVYGRSKDSEAGGDAPHCSEDDYELPAPAGVSSKEYDQVRLINIAVVKRGGCSFSTKVKIAAKKGAHAVIIADKAGSEFACDQMSNVVVAEDSYDDDVHIPSIFVCTGEGARLISEYKRQHAEGNPNPEPIVVELAWNVPTSQVVLVDQWMSAASRESLKFLREFAPKRRILNKVLRFEPHFTIFSMGRGGSADTTSKLCTDRTGKYCAEDPDGDGPVSGKEVIEEDLRQLCLHQVSKVKTGPTTHRQDHVAPMYADKYWAYIEQFADRCPLVSIGPPEKQFSSECSYALMREVGVTDSEIVEISSCANPAEAKELLERQRTHTAWSPRALRINGWRYSGIMDSELVATAVCAGFDREPEECALVKADRGNYQTAFIPVAQRGGVSFGTMISWILVSLAAMGVSFLFYKRHLINETRATIREEVMLEVEAQMGAYAIMKGA